MQSYWDSSHRREWTWSEEQYNGYLSELEEWNHFSRDELHILHAYFIWHTFEIAKKLKVKFPVAATAVVFFRRFFTRHSTITSCNPNVLVHAALFLASKAEYCPEHISSILLYSPLCKFELHIRNLASPLPIRAGEHRERGRSRGSSAPPSSAPTNNPLPGGKRGSKKGNEPPGNEDWPKEREGELSGGPGGGARGKPREPRQGRSSAKSDRGGHHSGAAPPHPPTTRGGPRQSAPPPPGAGGGAGEGQHRSQQPGHHRERERDRGGHKSGTHGSRSHGTSHRHRSRTHSTHEKRKSQAEEDHQNRIKQEFIQDILEAEFFLLQGLNFHLVVFHPFKDMDLMLDDLIATQPEASAVADVARKALNDSYYTPAILLFAPPSIAFGCLVFAAALSEVDLSKWASTLTLDRPDEIGKMVELLQVFYSTYSTNAHRERELVERLSGYMKTQAPMQPVRAVAPGEVQPEFMVI